MDFINQILPLCESIGFPALVFAIWYIYHQSQVKAFELIIQDNFEILKDLLETNQYHAALLSRIESKIDNNLSDFKKGGFINESRNFTNERNACRSKKEISHS